MPKTENDMRSITNRIEKLEKLLSLEADEKITEVIITLPESDTVLEGEEFLKARQEREKLGDCRDWITYQEQLEMARQEKKHNSTTPIILIGLSIEREKQARQFLNTPLAEQKKDKRIHEYMTVVKPKYEAQL
jgi:hypothetical protein